MARRLETLPRGTSEILLAKDSEKRVEAPRIAHICTRQEQALPIVAASPRKMLDTAIETGYWFGAQGKWKVEPRVEPAGG